MTSKKKKQSNVSLKQEDVLQAVVLADSFNVKFAPLTNNLPRALIPLANRPLLHYTLEFLFSNETQEIVIFCQSYRDKIEAYICSKWQDKIDDGSIIIISSQECLSVGDALRDLEKQKIIQNDFILVNGDLISNMSLLDILKEHKDRRIRDKGMVMTMIMKNAHPKHRTRCKDDNILMAVKNTNETVLFYKKLDSLKNIEIPTDIFANNDMVKIYNNLINTGISICSPKVLELFSDNFDHQTKEQFINGCIDEEIAGNNIGIYVIDNEYAARISSLHMYESISYDILDRWAFPIAPDVGLGIETSKCLYNRHNIYFDSSVQFDINCKLLKNVLIGENSHMGENVQITDSVIGINCRIGKNSVLKNSFLWDNVIVEDNCIINNSILANYVNVYNNVIIDKRCILAEKVSIGPNITLKTCSNLSLSSNQEINKDLGDKSNARYYVNIRDSIEDLTEWWDGTEEDDESSDDSESQTSDIIDELDDISGFYNELLGTLEKAIDENSSIDNIKLEINSIKAAYYLEIDTVISNIVKAFLKYPLKEESMAKYWEQFTKFFFKFKLLLKFYIKDEHSEKLCLNSFQNVADKEVIILNHATKFLKCFYDNDILSEESIIKWYNNEPSISVDLKAKVKKLIEWLEEAEEESDSD